MEIRNTCFKASTPQESELPKPQIGSGMSYTSKMAFLHSLWKSNNGFMFDPKDEYQDFMNSKNLLIIGQLGSARKYY